MSGGLGSHLSGSQSPVGLLTFPAHPGLASFEHVHVVTVNIYILNCIITQHLLLLEPGTRPLALDLEQCLVHSKAFSEHLLNERTYLFESDFLISQV